MREVVFIGAREEVLDRRDQALRAVSTFLDEHELDAEIRTASDPFFSGPDANAKTFFQLNSETKYEISLRIADDQRLAVGSLNYHSDFFGKVFDVTTSAGLPMHSVCVAFGLERWVHALIQQKGRAADHWPAPLRNAPEFQLL